MYNMIYELEEHVAQLSAMTTSSSQAHAIHLEPCMPGSAYCELVLDHTGP